MPTEWRTEGSEAIAAPTHIIERPRLIKLMEESGARIVVLHAPAGYGKTTLCAQWASQPETRAGWCQCTLASSDVAAFATQIARAGAHLAGVASLRLDDRLQATSDPEADVSELAELAAEDFRGLPPNAWLVVDDYHLAIESTVAERFLELLIQQTPVPRLLIASRKRPSWASARNVLYGQILYLDRLSLRMSDDEAEAVLGRFVSGGDDTALKSFLARADGWPAVIGLGALHPAQELPLNRASHRLGEFMAEEIMSALSDSTRHGLRSLAITPVITPDVASELLGADYRRVIDESVRLGLLTPRTAELEMHPLLRSYLERELLDTDDGAARVVTKAADALCRRGDWEAAVDLLYRFDRLEDLDSVVSAALGPLLSAGRLATLGNWVERAGDAGMSSGVLTLTEAEVEVRRGVHARAESLAMHATRSRDLPANLLSRCYSVAGEAAHLRDDDRRAFTYFQQGAAHATDGDDMERTLWGTFVAAVQLERPEAHDYLVAMNELEQPRVSTDLRKATGELVWAIRFAGIGDIDDWIARYDCYCDVQADPRIHTSFLHHFAYALACSAHYQKARAVIRQEASEARNYRLDFVGPLAHLQDALCLIGLRKHAKAARLLTQLHEIGLERGEDFILIETKMLMARLALAMGDADRAEELTREVPERIEPRGAYGQYLAVRALAFACKGDAVAARASADAARSATVTLEAHTVATLADAVVALAHNAAADNPLVTAWNAVTASGQYDLLVAAYRAQPAILRNLWSRPEIRPTLRSVLYRAADSAAADDLPEEPPRASNVLGRLTDRETEVLDLVADGMTNQEIAEKLFIGLSTVKVHIRHILEKLEVRSRTEAALLRVRQG